MYSFNLYKYTREDRCRAVVLIVFFFSLAGIFSVLYLRFERSGDNSLVAEVVEVRGTSMSPFLPQGTKLTLMRDYYTRHSVEKGDIVAYDYNGNPGAFIVKTVYAGPGDELSLVKEGNGYNILINNRVVKNHEGVSYNIPSANIRMLELYASSYPILPPDAYLILGESPEGSIDSTRFGLISRKDLAGKLVVMR